MDTRRATFLPISSSTTRLGRFTSEDSDDAPLAAVGGLVFNLRNVLFDDTAWRRWLLQLVHRMGLHTHYDAFYRCWEVEYLPDVRCGKIEYWDALKQYLASAGMSRGQLTEVEAAGRLRRERFHQQVRPFPAVARTNGRLSQAGLRLIAVETGSGEMEDPLHPLRQCGLERSFHAVVNRPMVDASFDQVAQLYSDALASARLPGDRVAVIGQDPRELRTAAAVGIRTVAFNARRDAEADHYLAQFSNLPRLCGIGDRQRLAG